MYTLLILTVCGSLMALLLLFLRFVMLRKMPSSVYYYLWILVLLRFVLPIPGLLPYHSSFSGTESESIPKQTESESIPKHESTAHLQTLPESDAEYYPEDIHVDTFVPPSDPSRDELPPESTVTGMPARGGLRLYLDWRSPSLWLGVWGCGAFISLAGYIASYVHYSSGIRRKMFAPSLFDRRLYALLPGNKPKLFRSSSVSTPMVFGLFKPVIVLPDVQFDDGMLKNILSHELMHYVRRDILYKWFAVLVYSVQWFNPITYIIRSEINHACELSCDEMLLRDMSKEEKKSYGNTLLFMASKKPLPAGVVATTFATEKKNLKERLEQIMHYKKGNLRLLAAILSILILAGCGAVAGPQAAPEVQEESPATDAAKAESEELIFEVRTVDELLAAIGPDRTIRLLSDTFLLTDASDYGEGGSDYYCWEQVCDGYELVLAGIENLTIEGSDDCLICTTPRYANVLKLIDCGNISLNAFTAGHSEEPGFCQGGVLFLENCRDTRINQCKLFGCGTIGIQVNSSRDVDVYDTDIYSCSYNAVGLVDCNKIEIRCCRFYDYEDTVTSLFRFEGCDGVSISDSEIHSARPQSLLRSRNSGNISFTNNNVRDCTFLSSVFSLSRPGVIVDACGFEDCSIITWFDGFHPVNADGIELSRDDMSGMTLGEPIQPPPAPEMPVVSASEDGTYEVGSVDEFLSAIGPNRTIVLTAELYDLSTASDYGTHGGEYYMWQEGFDGPQLVISCVDGMKIVSSDGEAKRHTISAVPRYANVLYFENCTDIELSGFTAGHTMEPGQCAGGVIMLQNCRSTSISSCRLFGCGILGIEAKNSSGLYVENTEIYECSQGGVHLYMTENVRFTNCSYHDLGGPAFSAIKCVNITAEGKPIENGYYNVEDGKPVLIHLIAPEYP